MKQEELARTLSRTASRYLGGTAVIEDLRPLSGGASSEMWHFDALCGDTRHELILRLSPPGGKKDPYRLDRLLTQIAGSASFGGVKALICGSLHRCRPVGECTATWRRRLAEIAPPSVPIVVDLPFGHRAANMAFPVGAVVTVDTGLGSVEWSG